MYTKLAERVAGDAIMGGFDTIAIAMVVGHILQVSPRTYIDFIPGSDVLSRQESNEDGKAAGRDTFGLQERRRDYFS